MRDTLGADLFTGPIERLLTFADAEYLCVERLVRTVATHSFK